MSLVFCTGLTLLDERFEEVRGDAVGHSLEKCRVEESMRLVGKRGRLPSVLVVTMF